MAKSDTSVICLPNLGARLFSASCNMTNPITIRLENSHNYESLRQVTVGLESNAFTLVNVRETVDMFYYDAVYKSFF